MSKTIIATFDNVPQANNAVNALFAQGFTQEEISMMVSDTTQKKHLAVETNTKAPEGAAIGSAAGGAVGALVAGLTAVAGIVIPGVGLAAVGPLVAALAGLGAGGAVGGLTGALVGLGFTELEAKSVEEAIKNGNVVVAVTSDNDDRLDFAKKNLEAADPIATARAA